MTTPGDGMRPCMHAPDAPVDDELSVWVRVYTRAIPHEWVHRQHRKIGDFLLLHGVEVGDVAGAVWPFGGARPTLDTAAGQVTALRVAVAVVVLVVTVLVAVAAHALS